MLFTFLPFANVNQTDKTTIGGSIGGQKETWQPWDYSKWIQVAENVAKFKSKLNDPDGRSVIYCIMLFPSSLWGTVFSPRGRPCNVVWLA